VDTIDALTGKEFKLHATVLWCIHDYPALSTLSGRTTKGSFACRHCDKDPLSYSTRGKIFTLDTTVSFIGIIVCARTMNIPLYMKAKIGQVHSQLKRC
jgi:hypothetical protein